MKKGFTLIELLAVIVILAIIAVIAVPITINIIEESKESATLRSAEFYLDAVELSLAQATLKEQNVLDGTYNILESGNICLEYKEDNTTCEEELVVEIKGNVPESGSIIISNGKIVEGTTINIENEYLLLNNENQMVIIDLKNSLYSKILGENKANVVSSGDGLYVSTTTNYGSSTYYYKGNITNNYVDFANLTWRIVRINEDGTIKLILNSRINDYLGVQFNPNYNNYKYMYYSESNVTHGIKQNVDNWYKSTLEGSYDSYISSTNFCEAAKVKVFSSFTSGNATMELSSSYTPNFECPLDGNGKQYVKEKVGLITADEVAMAGIPLRTDSPTYNSNTYLRYFNGWWTMSPAGFNTSNVARAYFVDGSGLVNLYEVNSTYPDVRPVISLNANVTVEESNGNGVHGSNTNPYVIKTN